MEQVALSYEESLLHQMNEVKLSIYDLEDQLSAKRYEFDLLERKLRRHTSAVKSQQDNITGTLPREAVIIPEPRKLEVTQQLGEGQTQSTELSSRQQPEEGKPNNSQSYTGIRPDQLFQSADNQTTKVESAPQVELRPQAPLSGSKTYVIYDGPNQGIYDSWALVAPIKQNYHHQAFSTRKEAELALQTYIVQKHQKKPIEQHQPKEQKAQFPESDYKKALASTKAAPNKNLVVLGRMFKQQPKITEKSKVFERPLVTKDHFIHNYLVAQTHDNCEEHRFFTVDSKTLSLYGFIEGADPEYVREAFHCGLISLIYPGENLKEISLLPKDLYRAIKNYRTRLCSAQSRPIYLRITSTFLEWENDDILIPYHWIEVGLSNGKIPWDKSYKKTATVEYLPEITALRPKRIKAVYNQCTKIFADSKKKLNYADDKIILISNYSELIKEKELITLSEYEARFTSGQLAITEKTARQWCLDAPEPHLCSRCEAARVVHKTHSEKASSTDTEKDNHSSSSNM
nr:putative inclusion body matrix protein [Strawberry vein banding virus]